MAEEMNCFTKLWTVKMGDWERGLVVAILSGPLSIIYQSLTATPISFQFNWKAILGTAIAAGIAYVGKNFITGIGGQLLSNKLPEVKVDETKKP